MLRQSAANSQHLQILGLLGFEQLAFDPGTFVNDYRRVAMRFKSVRPAPIGQMNIPGHQVIPAFDASDPPLFAFRFLHSTLLPNRLPTGHCLLPTYHESSREAKIFCNRLGSRLKWTVLPLRTYTRPGFAPLGFFTSFM